MPLAPSQQAPAEAAGEGVWRTLPAVSDDADPLGALLASASAAPGTAGSPLPSAPPGPAPVQRSTAVSSVSSPPRSPTPVPPASTRNREPPVVARRAQSPLLLRAPDQHMAHPRLPVSPGPLPVAPPGPAQSSSLVAPLPAGPPAPPASAQLSGGDDKPSRDNKPADLPLAAPPADPSAPSAAPAPAPPVQRSQDPTPAAPAVPPVSPERPASASPPASPAPAPRAPVAPTLGSEPLTAGMQPPGAAPRPADAGPAQAAEQQVATPEMPLAPLPPATPGEVAAPVQRTAGTSTPGSVPSPGPPTATPGPAPEPARPIIGQSPPPRRAGLGAPVQRTDSGSQPTSTPQTGLQPPAGRGPLGGSSLRPPPPAPPPPTSGASPASPPTASAEWPLQRRASGGLGVPSSTTPPTSTGAAPTSASAFPRPAAHLYESRPAQGGEPQELPLAHPQEAGPTGADTVQRSTTPGAVTAGAPADSGTSETASPRRPAEGSRQDAPILAAQPMAPAVHQPNPPASGALPSRTSRPEPVGPVVSRRTASTPAPVAHPPGAPASRYPAGGTVAQRQASGPAPLPAGAAPGSLPAGGERASAAPPMPLRSAGPSTVTSVRALPGWSTPQPSTGATVAPLIGVPTPPGARPPVVQRSASGTAGSAPAIPFGSPPGTLGGPAHAGLVTAAGGTDRPEPGFPSGEVRGLAAGHSTGSLPLHPAGSLAAAAPTSLPATTPPALGIAGAPPVAGGGGPAVRTVSRYSSTPGAAFVAPAGRVVPGQSAPAVQRSTAPAGGPGTRPGAVRPPAQGPASMRALPFPSLLAPPSVGVAPAGVPAGDLMPLLSPVPVPVPVPAAPAPVSYHDVQRFIGQLKPPRPAPPESPPTAPPPAPQSEQSGDGGGGDGLPSGRISELPPPVPQPAGDGGGGGVGAGMTNQELDRLANQLYGRLRARLVNELRLDRERSGHLSDLW